VSAPDLNGPVSYPIVAKVCSEEPDIEDHVNRGRGPLEIERGATADRNSG